MQAPNLQKTKTRTVQLLEAGWVWVLPFVIFAGLLLIPLPESIGVTARYGLSTLTVVLLILFYVGFRLPGKWNILVGLTLTLVLFAFALAGLWATGNTETNVLAGLFPSSDAGSYYLDSLQLLEGHPFSVFSGRRPIFSAFFAFLLTISGRNLQFSLAILVALNALACYLFVFEVQKSYGAAVASLTIVIIFMFYRSFIGKVMSEQLGLAFGCIGFALLLRGWRYASKRTVIFGLFIMTLGMMARAGAFLILPFLVLWAARAFSKGKLLSVSMLAGSAAGVLLGFLVNLLLFTMLVAPGAIPFSNFSYTLYGLARGGQSWGTFITEHPEAMTLQEPELSQTIYRIAINEIRNHPQQLVLGAAKAWQDFLKTPDCVFCFISIRNLGYLTPRTVAGFKIVPLAIITTLLYILSVAGLVGLFFEKDRAAAWLIGSMTAGLILSVPFLPPGDAGIRVYAVNIPMIAFLPASGLVAGLRGTRWQKNFSPVVELPASPLVSFSVLLALLTAVGPLVAWMLSTPTHFRTVTCPPGEEVLYIRLDRGSQVMKVDNSEERSWLPILRRDDFIQGNHNSDVTEMTGFLDQIPRSSTLVYTNDLQNQGMVWLVVQSDLLPPNSGVIAACGTLKTIGTNRLFTASAVYEADGS